MIEFIRLVGNMLLAIMVEMWVVGWLVPSFQSTLQAEKKKQGEYREQ